MAGLAVTFVAINGYLNGCSFDVGGFLLDLVREEVWFDGFAFIDDLKALIGKELYALGFYPTGEVCWGESQAGECRSGDANDGFQGGTRFIEKGALRFAEIKRLRILNVLFGFYAIKKPSV